jgi:uracil-DNA glycosylase family 4
VRRVTDVGASAPRTLKQLDAAICACERCPRLVDWCREVALTKRAAYAGEDYWGGPVPGFGSARPRIWIVGLAPGAHGANRTGRMFTGDRSGDWLFGALHRAGLAATPTSTSRGDGQRLEHVRITAAVHCAPPLNKPTPAEQHECAHWLHTELDIVTPTLRVALALGGIAWTATLAAFRDRGWSVPRVRFGHGAQAQVTRDGGRGPREVTVLGSYHPSQQNTFTGRLTTGMLDGVMTRVRAAADLSA